MRPAMRLAEYSPETQRLFWRVQKWYGATAVPILSGSVLAIVVRRPANDPVLTVVVFLLAFTALGMSAKGVSASRDFP
jgi:hypothetical protein